MSACTRDELTAYLHDYLACAGFSDYAPNGLQIEGRSTIKTICTAVTASEKVIREAAAKGAEALLVHHGYFWRGEEPIITSMKRHRIGQLLAHDINLYAYHLPLDCHPILGNNACLGAMLEAHSIEKHSIGKVNNLLWSGALSTALKPAELSAHITQKLKRTPFHVSGGQAKTIKRIAWCTGAAQDYIEDAHRLGVDAYLSGEISERTYYQAQELGIDYFACGHHATERYGIQALGKHLSECFKLTHEFIDSDNPI